MKTDKIKNIYANIESMKNICVLSDFDGTITVRDSLYTFFKDYAADGWKDVEKLWLDHSITSEECLKREFGLVKIFSKSLVDEYLKTVKIDEYFKSFYEFCADSGIDFFIVSDGVDYFINRVLADNGISDIKVISNHGEFSGDKLELSFPNKNDKCITGAGTCKCCAARIIKNNYEKIVYIGDGASDFCVADKADILFAKSSLENYCRSNNIKYIPYNNFNDVLTHIKNGEPASSLKIS